MGEKQTMLLRGTSWWQLLRLTLVMIAVPAATLLFPGAASTVASGNPIVDRALADLGTTQGQCWPWVRRVVQDSTGRTMGFDYRQGFFDAGAVEVSVIDARPGDIIQLADDSDTSPSADYIGLHTAIIVSIEGPGVFTVIDSNSQWDGRVRLRTSYDPAIAAARYPWIHFHIYRFSLPGDPGPPAGDAAPGSSRSGQPPAGDEASPFATVSTGGDCLNLRSGPNLAADVISCLPDGTGLRLSGPTSTADGYEWVQVSTGSSTGWVASDFIAVAGPPDPASQGRQPVFRTLVGPIVADGGSSP